jgi:hypothetical protein
MRKVFSGIALAILSFVFLVVTAGSSTAATVATPFADLRIGTIGYNAVGADTFNNRNKEFVDIVAVTNANVGDLVVSDSWGRVNNPDGVGCNAYKVTDLPGDATTTLPAGYTLRVHVGFGDPTFDAAKSRYNVFMNSNDDCGYHGHFLNNLGDHVFIAKSTNVESRYYGFENGYYV